MHQPSLAVAVLFVVSMLSLGSALFAIAARADVEESTRRYRR
jgi:hypothetical protein